MPKKSTKIYNRKFLIIPIFFIIIYGSLANQTVTPSFRHMFHNSTTRDINFRTLKVGPHVFPWVKDTDRGYHMIYPRDKVMEHYKDTVFFWLQRVSPYPENNSYPDLSQRYMCMGTLIDPDIVLTSWQCAWNIGNQTDNDPSQVHVKSKYGNCLVKDLATASDFTFKYELGSPNMTTTGKPKRPKKQMPYLNWTISEHDFAIVSVQPETGKSVAFQDLPKKWKRPPILYDFQKTFAFFAPRYRGLPWHKPGRSWYDIMYCCLDVTRYFIYFPEEVSRPSTLKNPGLFAGKRWATWLPSHPATCDYAYTYQMKDTDMVFCMQHNDPYDIYEKDVQFLGGGAIKNTQNKIIGIVSLPLPHLIIGNFLMNYQTRLADLIKTVRKAQPAKSFGANRSRTAHHPKIIYFKSNGSQEKSEVTEQENQETEEGEPETVTENNFGIKISFNFPIISTSIIFVFFRILLL